MIARVCAFSQLEARAFNTSRCLSLLGVGGVAVICLSANAITCISMMESLSGVDSS
jgi:hypothetical protein